MELMKWRALHYKVLVVAVKRIEGRNRDTNELFYSWGAYIKDVPGDNHEAEAQEVADHGDILPYKIAREIFPSLSGMRYA